MTHAEESREILAEVRGLFEAAFAWGTWGRLLVSLAPDSRGKLVVDDVLVEEILGDEEALDRAFRSAEAKACLPALAEAVLALCLLEDVPADRVTGGTFVQTHAGDLGFLPGLVRAPSPSLDARRDDLLARLQAKNAVLEQRYGIGAGASIAADMADGSVEIKKGGFAVAVGDQVVIGSFATADRAWVWGAHNPSLEAAARSRSAKLLDEIRDRSLWEISTAAFTTDQPSTWLLAALVAEERGLEGVAKVSAGPEGYVLLGLSSLSPAAVA